MPKPTFRNLPPEKRARIAEAAILEFAEKGYIGASISSIVARAGIAKGSFYQYFDGKIVLYRWLVYEHTGQAKLASLKRLPVSAPSDFWGQLATLLMGGLRFGLEHPRLSRLASELYHPSGDPELQQLVGEFQTLARTNWRGLLEQGQAMGDVREDLDLDLAAEMMVAMLVQGMDLTLQRKAGMDLIDFCSHPELEHLFPVEEQREMIDGIVDLLRRAVGTPEHRPSDQDRIDLDAVMEGLGNGLDLG